MNKIIIALLFAISSANMMAQSVTVSDFHLDETDPTANLKGTTVLDRDGEKCALIKIETTKTGFTYDVGTLGVQDTKQKIGQIWVYVPSGVKKIILNHPTYSPCEYKFPIELQKARTYIMKLAIAENFHTQQLNIKYSPAHAIILLDGELVEASNGKISMDILQGVHEYTVVASGYASQSGSIEMNMKYPYNLNVNLVRNTQPITLLDKFKPIKPFQAEDAKSFNSNTTLKPRKFTIDSIDFTMIPVEEGTFVMGATSEQEDANEDESPLHQVFLSGYYIGETEITQQLWTAVMGANPSLMTGSQRPVEYVTWTMCQTFISRLNEITGEKFRLPTEAEWEFAARGGNKTRTTQYSGSERLHEVGWDTDNSMNMTHNVKSKKPNELGIYDMSGNVSEWCLDWKGAYTSTAKTNPTGPTSGLRKVVRGGSWNSYSSGECRTAARSSKVPEERNNNMGFRIVLDM